jgi:hypothetical protein
VIMFCLYRNACLWPGVVPTPLSANWLRSDARAVCWPVAISQLALGAIWSGRARFAFPYAALPDCARSAASWAASRRARPRSSIGRDTWIKYAVITGGVARMNIVSIIGCIFRWTVPEDMTGCVQLETLSVANTRRFVVSLPERGSHDE